MSSLLKKYIYLLLFGAVTNMSFATNVVPFDLVNGLIIIEAEVNGARGNYIVDSGSNGILLNENSKMSDISYQTLTSTLEGTETKIESFKVGNFEVSELLGFSTDLSNLEVYLNKSIDGILGCSIFTPNSLMFDFSDSKMIISEDDLNLLDVTEFASLSFKIIEDLPIVELTVEGKYYSFILDSGASSHFIDTDLIKANKDVVNPTGIQKSIVTAGGQDKISLEYLVSNCNIGGLKVPVTAFEKDFSLISETLDYEISGLLSLSKLSTGKVYFDLKSNILYYN